MLPLEMMQNHDSTDLMMVIMILVVTRITPTFRKLGATTIRNDKHANSRGTR